MRKSKTRWKRTAMIIGGAAATIAMAYSVFVFSSIPFVEKWRTLYIETAMGTMTHQWLATSFIPQSVIDSVMKDVEKQFENNKVESSTIANVVKDTVPEETRPLEVSPEEKAFAEFKALFPEIDIATLAKNIAWDQLASFQEENLEGVLTTAGDKVWAIDVPNKILICTVTGDGYAGKLAIIKDSSQVMLSSNQLSDRGQTVTEHCEANDAVVGINASGFYDPNGKGRGHIPVGLVLSNGQLSGEAMGGRYQIAGYDRENNFRVGYGLDVSELRDAMQFYPIIVLDGKNNTDGSYGLGIQPRTAIGQTADGATLFLVIDGRQVGHSLGTTVSECANILIRYGCWTAMNMDGGSSSSMTYMGKMITRTSSPMKEGRYLPDAWVAKRIS